MKRLKVAQIGMSETAHAAHILNALLNMPDEYEVVGIADVDTHYFKNQPPVFSKVPKMSVDEILSLPLDAVFIETDEVLQTKYATMAIERGFNVSVDKPGSQDDESFDRLVDMAKEKNLVFFMNYMYRYNPAVMYAKEKISEGMIGEVVSIEAQMNCYHGNGFRNRYKHFTGGIMYYLGCHMTDIIYSVLGEPLEVIPFNTCTGDEGVLAEDFGMAVLKYKNGASIAKVNAAEVAGAPMRRSVIFSGTKGTIEIRPIERPVAGGLDTTEIYEHYLGDESVYHKIFTPYGRYSYMLSEFARIVRGESAPAYSYEYERALHKLILKCCGVDSVK